MYVVCSNTDIDVFSLQPKCIEFISDRLFRIRGYARRYSPHLCFKLIFKHTVDNSFEVADLFNAVFIWNEGCLMVTNNLRCRGDCPCPYLPLIASMTHNNIHKMERRKETACTPAGSPRSISGTTALDLTQVNKRTLQRRL